MVRRWPARIQTPFHFPCLPNLGLCYLETILMNCLVSSKSAVSSGSSSPILPEMDDDTMAAFPSGEPRKEKLDLVICKHCKRNIMRLHAKEHISGCLRSKQEKARKKKEARDATARAKEKAERKGDDKDDDVSDSEVKVDSKPSASGARKSTSKTSNGNTNEDSTKKSKKRKADAEEDKSEPKKKKNKKDEPKPKAAPKPKGPVDVEKQCGVVLPNGAQCARSLTCKSHSMGAKRAVPGRSLPYDMLLQAYQKKNQARQQSKSLFSCLPVSSSNTDEIIKRSSNIRQSPRPLRLRPRRPFQHQRRTHRLRLRARRRDGISRPQLQPRISALCARLQPLLQQQQQQQRQQQQYRHPRPPTTRIPHNLPNPSEIPISAHERNALNRPQRKQRRRFVRGAGPESWNAAECQTRTFSGRSRRWWWWWGRNDGK